MAGKRAPQSSLVTIEHGEPSLKYSGTLVEATGAGSRQFQFEGVIDGRLDARTIASEFHSGDGAFVERTRTSISRDGRVLRRRIELKSPDGLFTWTEVYDKR
ncbi:MAG: hypothetical protein IT158_06600 [Bryobacterales bacterium]|nr:hypothetical protein [Bryobacterales bacterium]